jgi:hypothetical protein
MDPLNRNRPALERARTNRGSAGVTIKQQHDATRGERQ